MSNLVLELRQGEMMIINGAPIRFRTKSRIELTAKARFLFGKQIMAPDEADSPARRIYFALQSAYIGAEEERANGLIAARELIAANKPPRRHWPATFSIALCRPPKPTTATRR
jgi:flagellar biosynthesis repressor protein FlbT